MRARMRKILPLMAAAAIPMVAGIGSVAEARATPARRAVERSSPDAIRRLDVLILVYPRSFSRELTPAQLERLHEEIVEFADFYRRHGAGRVDFRFSLLRIDRTLHRHEVGEVAPGRYYLSREDVEAELRDLLGERAETFDEVVAFYAWNDANPAGAALAYGGAAVGPDGEFLGDAGYNSIGVFAWNPGRIAQVAVHEVLHNVDDMFSRSGMADGFLDSDEMSRNMALLLRERPGGFLPYHTDEEMLAYAERERAGREMYPWWMQRIYYAWMLARTPAEAWAKLEYGRMVAPRAPAAYRALYDDVYVSRAARRLYVPVLAELGAGDESTPDTLRLHLPGASFALPPLQYALEDFDGTPLVRGEYHAGWVEPPAGEDAVTASLACPAAATDRCDGIGPGPRIHRLRLAEVVGPGRIVVWDERAAEPPPIEVELREAAWPGPGPRLAAERIEARALDAGSVSPGSRGAHALDFEPSGDGRYVARPPASSGSATWEIDAAAPGFAVAPARVTLDRRSPWGVERPRSIEAPMGSPFNIRVAARHHRPVEGVRVAARGGMVGEVELRRLPGGEYTANLDGLPPGVHELTIVAERGSGEAKERVVADLRVYARPRGWVRVPRRIEAERGRPLALEARVVDRMGEVVTGTALPLVAIAGDRVVRLERRGEHGEYHGALPLPAGEHRVYVTSLVGDFQRRVVLVDADEDAAISSAANGRAAVRPPADASPSARAVAVRDAGARPGAGDGAGTGAATPALADIAHAVAARMADPPALDARLDEWTHEPLTLDATNPLLTDAEHYGGDGDLSARLWFAWDDSTLYAAGEVTDDDVTAGEAWDRDRINLVFDWREDTTPLTYDEPSPPSSAWQPDDYWVYFQPLREDGGAGTVRRLDRRAHGPAEGAKVASRRTAAGYVFETRIPATALPEFGAFVAHVAGLQVFISDGDRGEPLTELMWSARWGHDGGIAWELDRTGRLVFAGERLR